MTELAHGRGGRSWALAGVLLLVVSACAAPSDSGLPSAVPTGPLADIDFQPLPAIEDITFVAAAEAELELIAQMREDAGFAELLGPDGDAILEALDEAYREHGEATLPIFVEALGVDLEAASLGVATLPGSPGYGPPAPRTEWSGSLLGQTSVTITMTMALMASVVSTAGTDRSGSQSKTDSYTKSVGSNTEQIDITTTYDITSGGGRVSADITIESTDVIRDSTGAEIAHLNGTGHGHIDVSACPDESGEAAGTYTLEWEEEMSGSAGSAGSSSSTEAPFTIWNGDDAHWTRIDTTMDLERGASGAGTPSGDWSVEASVPMTIPARGNTVIGYDAATVDGTNASTAQLTGAMTGTFGAQLFLVEVAKAAEKFWRSGECIELETSEESREVDPEEEVSFSVEATHKFDGAQVAAQVTAEFTGKETLEPANTPMDPPATFDFTAGSEPGDVGTIKLKQTGRRGIGLKTLTFTVAGADLLVTYNGTLEVPAQTGGFNGSFVLAEVRLTGTGGTLSGSGSLQVTGSVTATPCTGAVNQAVDATVTATRDEADSNLVQVALEVQAGAHTTTMQCPDGLTFPFPLSATIQLWYAPLQAPIAVPIDGSETVPAAGGAGGSTTITVERVEPSS